MENLYFCPDCHDVNSSNRETSDDIIVISALQLVYCFPIINTDFEKLELTSISVFLVLQLVLVRRYGWTVKMKSAYFWIPFSPWCFSMQPAILRLWTKDQEKAHGPVFQQLRKSHHLQVQHLEGGLASLTLVFFFQFS